MEDRVVLSLDVNPTHYDLRVETNVDNPNASGELNFNATVDISMEVKSVGLKTITLHSKELVYHNCTYVADGSEDEVEASQINLNVESTTVDFVFGPEIPQGSGKLHVEFMGLHNNQMAGFYRSKYTSREGETKTMVSTQFESLDARRCFPCVDEPGRKATFECRLVVNEELVALSNMPVVEEKVVGNGRKEVRFETSPMMSTYLLAFVVGEFDYIEGKTENGVVLRVYVPPGKQHLGDFALEVGLKALDLFDETFGEKFPLPKMDMVGIPEFAAGAMENWGLITYREVDLLLDLANSSAVQKMRVCSVVVHELAHQWFGNLVTMEWWSDLWLNEGFASYMESYIMHKLYPGWQVHEQFIVDTQNPALLLDALQSSHPIQVPIKHAEEVEEVFDLISYQKGASVVRLAYAMLGENCFLDGLREYMDKHKYSNTVTKDLWTAWENASDLPVGDIMSSWTEQMGFPLVTVIEEEWKPEEGKCKLTLEQQWFLSDGSLPSEGLGKIWKIPVFVSTKDGTMKHEDLFEHKTQTFEFDIKADDKWIKVNGGQNVPLRVNYSMEMWERLTKGLEEGQLQDNCDQSGLLVDALALTQAQKLDPVVLLRLLSTFKKEESYPVWKAIRTCVSALSSTLIEEAELSKEFGSFVSSLVNEKAEAIGWDSSSQDELTVRLLRGLLINLQCAFSGRKKSIRDEATERFKEYVKDPFAPGVAERVPADLKRSIFKVALQNPDYPNAYTELREVFTKMTTAIDRKDIYLTIGSTPDSKARMEVLNWATSGEVAIQDFFYAVSSVSANGLEGLELAWDYFRENYDKIYEMVKTANPSILTAIVRVSASGFASEKRAVEVEEFFKEKNLPALTRSLAQILEKTRGRAKFAAYLKGSSAFIEYLKSQKSGEEAKIVQNEVKSVNELTGVTAKPRVTFGPPKEAAKKKPLVRRAGYSPYGFTGFPPRTSVNRTRSTSSTTSRRWVHIGHGRYAPASD